jgi:DNA invertase Pin-like site-specific DNA recombinase
MHYFHMGVVQFERELIRERKREGIAIAKREGKHTAGNRL